MTTQIATRIPTPRRRAMRGPEGQPRLHHSWCSRHEGAGHPQNCFGAPRLIEGVECQLTGGADEDVVLILVGEDDLIRADERPDLVALILAAQSAA